MRTGIMAAMVMVLGVVGSTLITVWALMWVLQ